MNRSENFMKYASSFLVMFFLSVWSGAHSTGVRTIDASGAPYPNVLVIIKSLEGAGEIGRYLTDQDGRIPNVKLDDGLYQIITTCPYGTCRTAVHEFIASDVTSEITLKVELNPSDIGGEIIGAPKIQLTLVTPDGRPAAHARVFVRDQDATHEKWYIADDKAGVTIELVDDPSVLVIVYANQATIREIGLDCKSQRAGFSAVKECLTVNPLQGARLVVAPRNRP